MREFDDIRRGDHICSDCLIYEVLAPPTRFDDDAVVVMRRIPLDGRAAGLPIEVPLIKLERLAYAGRAIRVARPSEGDDAIAAIPPGAPRPARVDTGVVA